MQPFHKIVAPTTQELFLQEMLSALLSGDIKPGEKLPSERSLAEQMDVSKTVVHNGMKELEHSGFVKTKPQSGVYAADYLKDGNLDTLSAIAHYSGGNLSYELVQSFTDALLTIDNMAFQLFVRRPGDKSKELQQLYDQVEDIGFALTNPTLAPDRKAKEMERFFYTLTQLSGKSVLPFMMNTIQEPSEAIWEDFIRISPPEDIINVAAGIVHALENNNAGQAYSLLEQAISRYLEQIHP